jgi:hypothetical protein
LREASTRRYVPPFNYATIHAGLGEKDLAFKLLENCTEDCNPWFRALSTDPLFDFLRSDPRFAGLVRRGGLTP